jgi:ribosome-binding protein aMBF1 (putative translation factor)
MAQNIVGPQVRRCRDQRGWSQDMLAARLQRHGWDISRGTLAKIEAQVRCVRDVEVLELSRALGVAVGDLFPPAGKTCQ